MKNRIHKRLLLGLGFDCKDGHIRVTKGNNFRLYGGSEETHKFMQEKAIKFNEQLDKKHKTLNDVDVNEFYDIAEKIGLKISDDFKKKKKKGE